MKSHLPFLKRQVKNRPLPCKNRSYPFGIASLSHTAHHRHWLKGNVRSTVTGQPIRLKATIFMEMWLTVILQRQNFTRTQVNIRGSRSTPCSFQTMMMMRMTMEVKRSRAYGIDRRLSFSTFGFSTFGFSNLVFCRFAGCSLGPVSNVS